MEPLKTIQIAVSTDKEKTALMITATGRWNIFELVGVLETAKDKLMKERMGETPSPGVEFR